MRSSLARHFAVGAKLEESAQSIPRKKTIERLSPVRSSTRGRCRSRLAAGEDIACSSPAKGWSGSLAHVTRVHTKVQASRAAVTRLLVHWVYRSRRSGGAMELPSRGGQGACGLPRSLIKRQFATPSPAEALAKRRPSLLVIGPVR